MLTFRWIKISPFLILMLQFTVFSAATNLSYLTVRVGNEVTLPCESVNKSQRGCPSWIFHASSTDTIQLTSNGQIVEKARNKSARLSVTADCSLVIKNIAVEDVGQYACKSEELQRQDRSLKVDLSVINMTEQQNNDKIILNCSVWAYDNCIYTVEWLYEGKQNTSSDMVMSPRACSATVTFTTSQFNQKSNFYQSLMCKVTHQVTKEQLFPFSPPSSDEKPGSSLIFILVPVALAALLTVVAIIICKKNKGNKMQRQENTAPSMNPAETHSGPESSQDTHNPEDGVNYASISYTRKDNNKSNAQVCDDDNDECITVTYSTVKAPSSSAEDSTDQSNLCSTISK